MNNIKHIPFTINGRDYIADILDRDGSDMIAIKPICEAIGIQHRKQSEKLQANPLFNWTLMCTVARDGRKRDMACISIDQVATWLSTINSAKVKSDARDVLLQFQQHCQRELYAAVTGRAGIEKVNLLEERVVTLEGQIGLLTKAVGVQGDTISMQNNIIGRQQTMIDTQQTTINNLQAAQADADQTEAEVAGKYLARAKKTKHLRSIH